MILVAGTSTLLSACVEANVEYVVYTSTMDVVIGYEPIRDGDESLQSPDQLLFGSYASTKRTAENQVLAYNGKTLPNGRFK